MCSKRSGLNLYQDKLDDLKGQGRYRSLSLPHGVDLTSNDYLGLANCDLLRAAAIDFLQQGGDIGAGGSRLLRGHTDAHQVLEDYAAEFFAAPRALYFASGFQANTTLFQTLPSRHDVIVFDEFVHASAREGIQNSHAHHIKVQHNDVDAFDSACRRAREQYSGRIWIAVESIYSMDGDVAPLKVLYEIAARYDAILVVDEAHGTGVMGAHGRGVSEALITQHGYDRIIVLHTCGKTIGVAGGLICASSDVVEMMINAARGFIYSTAPMPLQAYLVQKSLEIIAGDEGATRRKRLIDLSQKAQQLFGREGAHIVPIIIGDNDRCVAVAEMLQQKGWDIRAIRPPTVPNGTARLRLSLSANLDDETLEKFAEDLFIAQGR